MVIPNGMLEIGDCAFKNCKSLHSVTISNSINRIGREAFANCTRLETVIFGNKVTEISSAAFCNCKCLKAITMPDGLKEIADLTFEECIMLKNVILPSGITRIGYKAFGNCGQIRSLDLPQSVSTIEEKAFYGCEGLADKYSFVIVNNVLYSYHGNATNIVVPFGVTKISFGAFDGCNGLVSIEIPSSVHEISEMAFSNCTDLQKITFPSNLKILYFDHKTDFNNFDRQLISKNSDASRDTVEISHIRFCDYSNSFIIDVYCKEEFTYDECIVGYDECSIGDGFFLYDEMILGDVFAENRESTLDVKNEFFKVIPSSEPMTLELISLKNCEDEFH